jgi:hypothetical protein
MTADQGRPPLLKTWGRVYALVLANLALLIVFFYILTRELS